MTRAAGGHLFTSGYGEARVKGIQEMGVKPTDDEQRAAVESLEALAAFATDLKYENLPEEVVSRARHVLINSAACALLGSENVRLEPVEALVSLFGAADEATVVGTGTRAAAPAAAWVNTARVNSTELSEGVSKGSVHPGTMIIPALLAEGERLGADGKELLRAIVAGYEVLIRVGWALSHDPAQPRDTIQAQSLHEGWYPPALLGAFGVAAAVGVLHDVDRDTLLEAFGIVGNLTPTATFASFRNGADAKPLASGWASALGITAVRLAREGLTGGRQIAPELFPLLVSSVDYDLLAADLGEVWEIMRLDIKFFGAGPVLSEIECAIQMREKYEFDVADIDRIDVETNSRTMLCNRRYPTTPTGAKGSVPYCVAQPLLGRTREDMVANAFAPDVVASGDWRAVADKVHLSLDTEFDRVFETNPPAYRPSRLTLTMRDGSKLVNEVQGVYGLPGFPPRESDFVNKYRAIARRYFTESAVDEQIERLLTIERVDDVGSVVPLLTYQPSSR